MTFNSTCAAAMLAAVATVSASSIASAAPKLVAGTLTCYGQGSIGAIIGSKQTLRCSFNPAGPGRNARYAATITRVGVDIGVTGQSTMIWTVLASTDPLPRGALNGNYGGVSADASVGIGGGANALVGGLESFDRAAAGLGQRPDRPQLGGGVAELSLRQRYGHSGGSRAFDAQPRAYWQRHMAPRSKCK